jgi:hypothetical protein
MYCSGTAVIEQTRRHSALKKSSSVTNLERRIVLSTISSLGYFTVHKCEFEIITR